eukprot:jgi/Tetstr1/435338/TSEL_024256.t1
MTGRNKLFTSDFGRDRDAAARLLLAGAGISGYGGPAAPCRPRPERRTARPGPITTPAPGRHSSRRLGGLLGLLGRGLRATALVDVVAGDGLRGGEVLDRALVLCLMMPPAVFCNCAITPTKPWSCGDAAVPASGSDTALLR